MTSIKLVIRGENKTKEIIAIIAKQHSILSTDHHKLIHHILDTFKSNSFRMTPEIKALLISKMGVTENNLSVMITRLVKSGALIKSGRLYGLSPAFSGCEGIQQVIIQVI